MDPARRNHSHFITGLVILAALCGLAAQQAMSSAMDRMDDEALLLERPAAERADVGRRAPNFALADLGGRETIELGSLSGSPVILCFGSYT